MRNPWGILWSHPWHLGFPLWRLTICGGACCIVSRAALDSLRIPFHFSSWERLRYVAPCVSPGGEGGDGVFSLILTKLPRLSEGRMLWRSSSQAKDTACVLRRCTATHTHRLRGGTRRLFGLSLTAFSLLCVPVTLLSTEALLEMTLKCVL